MNATTSLCFVLLGSSLAGMLFCAGASAETFRWTDEQGNVHYSDRVPPDQAKHRRSKLNPQGMEVEVIEGAKSPEQLAREKQLKQLRAEQQRLMAEQRDRDLSLLRTYRSEEEMHMALQGKLSTIDSAVKITTANRQRQEEILLGQEKRAADLEVQGQAVPRNLRDNIDTTRRQIASYQEKTKNLEAEKLAITERFSKDIERFKALKAAQQDPALSSGWHEQDSPTNEVPIVSAVVCHPDAICDRAWTLAKAYVQANTNKPLVTETDRILQTAAPMEDKDIALIITRIEGKTEDTVFLDVRCRSSSLGEEWCASAKVKDIRAGFKPYIENGLTNPP